jgi:hypothetical protein
MAQEKGFSPHYVGRSWFTRNGGKKGHAVFGQWMDSKDIPGHFKGLIVKGYTPYIAPAVMNATKKFPRMYSKKILAAIIKEYRRLHTSRGFARGLGRRLS